MTFILPSFGASAISTVPGSGGGGGASYSNTYSLDFDGTNDFVNLGSSSDFDSVSAFTISAWIKADSFSGYPMILAKTNGTTGKAFQLYIDESTSKPTLAVNFSGFSSSTDAISTGVWTHIAVSWTSGTGAVAYYINGSASGTATGSTSITTNTDDCCIGAKPQGAGFANYFNGLMDEVSFFNSALSSSDVTAIYNSGVPGDLSSYSPTSWWRMGDNNSGSGTTITDQGSGGNNGTLTNGPTFSTDVPLPAWSGNTYSLDFDGTNDYLDLSSAASLLNSQSVVTMSFWYYADNYGIVAGARASNSDVFAFWPYDASNFYWVGRNGGGGTVTASNPGLNQWVHCVGVKDGTSATLYLTPTSTGITATTTGTLDGTLSATLGNSFRVASDAFANSYFNGKVDEVAVWNSALSASDVTTLYNSGVPGDISSLNPVGWWRMGDNDGGTGTTITDQGSGGNDGTLTNGPTFSTDVPT